MKKLTRTRKPTLKSRIPDGMKPGRLLYFMFHELPDADPVPENSEFFRGGDMRPCISMDISV